MKKKNNKGFFLAEAIVVIALITIVMAFVYPNVAKLYDNYSRKANYYDQIQDLYVLKALESSMTDNFLCNFTNPLKSGSDAITTVAIASESNKLIGGLKMVYLTNYMTSAGSDKLAPNDPYYNNYDFNKYLRRLRKTTYDNKAYRLVGVVEEIVDGKKETRFASIKTYIKRCN